MGYYDDEKDYYDSYNSFEYSGDYLDEEIKTISKKEIIEESNKFKVPSKIFEALALYEPKFFNKHGIISLKYHIVMLERFDMLEELEEICNDNNNFDEITEVLDIFKIPTKYLYSYLSFINDIKKKNGLEKIYDITKKSNIKMEKGLSKVTKKFKEHCEKEPTLSEVYALTSTNYDSFDFDDTEKIKEAFPYDKTLLSIWVKEYDKRWIKREKFSKNRVK